MKDHLFICFAAEDRYSIAEPIVHHLKNYGIKIWYDRYELLLGDNRRKKNLYEGATLCKYAIVIISKYTLKSKCAMEEINIIRKRYRQGDVTVFPILYEIHPDKIGNNINWIKKIIFKEIDKKSGTREICAHIVCRITKDILKKYELRNIQAILDNVKDYQLPVATYDILNCYQKVDNKNINSKVSLLFASYLMIKHSIVLESNQNIDMISRIFERLFSETRLNIAIDYRELWLLENSICILSNYYIKSCTESKI